MNTTPSTTTIKTKKKRPYKKTGKYAKKRSSTSPTTNRAFQRLAAAYASLTSLTKDERELVIKWAN